MISGQNLCQFLIWTNLFFLVPLARALTLSAWPEATILLWTTLVSIVHHGCGHCTADLVPNLYANGLVALLLSVFLALTSLLARSLAADTLVRWASLLLGLLLTVVVSVLVVVVDDVGVVVAALCVVAVVLLLVYVILSGPARTRQSPLALCSVMCIALVAYIVALALFVAAVVMGEDEGDLCFGASPTTWSVLDFYTATSALIAVIVYALSIRWHPSGAAVSDVDVRYIANASNMKFAVFMLLATPLLVLSLLSSPLGNSVISKVAAYGILAVLLILVILARVLYGAAANSSSSLAEWRGEYMFWPYGILAIVFALGAFLLFFLLNDGFGHGYWHILAAFAIYFALESVHGRLVFIVAQ